MPFTEGEEVRLYEDVKEDSVSELIDFNNTWSMSDIITGDILVIQRASEVQKYEDVYKKVPFLPILPAPSTANIALTHAAKLWDTRRGSDILLRYGTDATLTMPCHRAMLSVSPYFDTLLNNDQFSAVSETTIDPSHHPHAVELVLKFMYFGDPTILTECNPELVVPALQFADFIDLVVAVDILMHSFRVLDAKMASDALEVVLACPRAASLGAVVVKWVRQNRISLIEGPLKELLRRSDEAYTLVMKGLMGLK
jgi:BTB/POZ domain-containing protein/ubiquitin-specific protease-like protein